MHLKLGYNLLYRSSIICVYNILYIYLFMHVIIGYNLLYRWCIICGYNQLYIIVHAFCTWVDIAMIYYVQGIVKQVYIGLGIELQVQTSNIAILSLKNIKIVKIVLSFCVYIWYFKTTSARDSNLSMYKFYSIWNLTNIA